MRRLVVITDIPTPYRIHMFRALEQVAASRGGETEVLFAARTLPTRFWDPDPASFGFRHRIVEGFRPRAGDAFLHVNPKLVREAMRSHPDWILLGGSWAMPTVWATVAAARLRRRRTQLILWSEANRHAETHRSGPVFHLRRLLASQVDAFAVPGAIARSTIQEDWRVRGKPFYELPNLVDETRFRDQVDQRRERADDVRQELGINAGSILALWSARVHEATKGTLTFLRHAAPVLRDQALEVVITSEGPDERRVSSLCAEELLENVRILGRQSEDRMLDLYAAADLLLLPSLRDPNPLAVIEGLWAGLPLLVSERCGNWPEAVDRDANGWVVDPDDGASVRAALQSVLRTGRTGLRSMGAVSRKRAELGFDTRRALAAFVDQLSS